MRARVSADGLTVHAIAGTHVVLLGFDVENIDDFDGLGFAIRRTDHTTKNTDYLSGLKVFESVVPHPVRGHGYSTRANPVQGFQWGDYSAQPGRSYTYRIAVVRGPVGPRPPLGAFVDVEVTTELEDDGLHGVWFNRGVAESPGWHRQGFSPPKQELANPDSRAWGWLSRGLGEAFLRTIDTAADSSWAIRGAFYEFTWEKALTAFAQARDRGVDVQLVVHGRDKDAAGAKNHDTTAEAAHAAAKAAGIDDLVTWRTAPPKSALQHNKFIVLLNGGEPLAVWTGSTNVTKGAVYGHSNVGHLIHDATFAASFLNYWTQLHAGTSMPALRQHTETHDPVAGPLPPIIFSPRQMTSDLLARYAGAVDAATSSAHFTGAFGLNAVFRTLLAQPRDYPRTVLLDKEPPPKGAIPHTDPNVRVVWGAVLVTELDQWAVEHLTDFNPMVRFIHLKVLLIDPFTDTPTVLTGSANYSDNSTQDNEENTVVLREGNLPALSAAAVRRVSDIYVTEYNRLFQHHLLRAFENAGAPGVVKTDGEFLKEDGSWIVPYRSGWRAGQRHLFAGTKA